PAVTVHRNIQVNLVAGRAKLRGLIAHKRFEERLLVGLGVQIRQEIIDGADVAIVAGGQFVQRRILDFQIRVSDGTAQVHDGMARHATEARLRLRSIDLLADGAVKTAIEEYGG